LHLRIGTNIVSEYEYRTDPVEGAVATIIPDAQTARLAGADIRYVQAGTGQPLVLLHPLRAQLEYFVALMSQLDMTRFHVSVPDLPGHGWSSAPRRAYTAGFFTETVSALLDYWDVNDAVVVGESIGASIALMLAGRANPRIARVVALNPYDYGRRGGIRRSSGLANVVFTSMLWPGIGSLVARVGNKAVLRRILEGGVHDPRSLPAQLVDDLHAAGSRTGHAGAFRSLMCNWATWIAARDCYGAISVPVTLSYGEYDWSRPDERDADAQAIPGARAITLPGCGHFSSLERPGDIAHLVQADSA
jgi:pimeloyl-ACP methyl ester carboxylesterase